MTWRTFWMLLVGASVAWYSTVTVYVAIKGARDIKKMLARLRQQCEEQPKDCV